MRAIVAGLDINYEQAGKGPHMLLVHGWGSNLKTFDGLSTSLAKKFTVTRLDLPGFGGSQPPNHPWELDDYASLLVRFLQKLNITNLHALIGHSLGGRIAIRAQSTGKVMSERLVLLASHGIANPHSPRLLAYRLVAKLGKAAVFFMPASFKTKLRDRLYRAAGSTDYLHVTSSMSQTFKNIINQDLRSDAAHVRTKTLLIYGSNDTMTPPKLGKLLSSKIPHAKMTVIAGAGHYVHNDAPGEVADLIGAFL